MSSALWVDVLSFKMQTKECFKPILVFLSIFLILVNEQRCSANEIEVSPI